MYKQRKNIPTNSVTISEKKGEGVDIIAELDKLPTVLGASRIF
jgi:hypothetical protein